MIDLDMLDRVLQSDPEAAAQQMKNQQDAMEMLAQIKALIDTRFNDIEQGLKNVPEYGVKFAMNHNAQVVTNVIAAHMVTRIIGQPPTPTDLEHFLAACAVAAYEDFEDFKKRKESAS